MITYSYKALLYECARMHMAQDFPLGVTALNRLAAARQNIIAHECLPSVTVDIIERIPDHRDTFTVHWSEPDIHLCLPYSVSG